MLHCQNGILDNQEGALDFVDFLQDRFGVEISCEDLFNTNSPRKLADLILARLTSVRTQVCLSQRAFHELRKALVDIAGVPRSAVRTWTPLEELLPARGRRATWRLIETALKPRKWPSLARPKCLVWLLSTLVAIPGLVVARQAKNWLELLFALVATCILGWLAAIASRPLASGFRPGYASVGDLVQHLVANNSYVDRDSSKVVFIDDHNWTRERVSCAIREVLLEIRITEFNQDTAFF